MTTTTKDLERLALDAHKAGHSWSTFWASHGDAVRRAEPWNRERFRRLVDRLLALVCSGDTGGMYAVGDDMAPWDQDAALEVEGQ